MKILRIVKDAKIEPVEGKQGIGSILFAIFGFKFIYPCRCILVVGWVRIEYHYDKQKTGSLFDMFDILGLK